MKRSLALALLLCPAATDPAPAQTPEELPGRGVSVLALGGWFSGYTGGATYLLALAWREPDALEVEAIIQAVPREHGDKRMYLLGVHRSAPWRGTKASGGGRAGLVDGPSYRGYIAQAVGAVEARRGRLSLRLEPSAWLGFDETFGFGSQLAAGVVWHLD